MILILCIDDEGGISFRGRRQSRDRVLRERLLERAKGQPIYMSAYSRRVFTEGDAVILSDPGDVALLKKDALFFLEDFPFPETVDAWILYRWNRRYPADRHLDRTPESYGLSLVSSESFPGSSHDKITEEIYVKKEATE